MARYNVSQAHSMHSAPCTPRQGTRPHARHAAWCFDRPADRPMVRRIAGCRRGTSKAGPPPATSAAARVEASEFEVSICHRNRFGAVCRASRNDPPAWLQAVMEEPLTSKKKDAQRGTNWRSSKVPASRPTWDNTALLQHSKTGDCRKSCSGVCGMLLATPLAEPGVQRVFRSVAASLRLQAPASRAGGRRNMLVGLGFGILVLFSAFAGSSSAAAKTDGAPVDLTAMGSAWATPDGFGTPDIGRPMQV
jgi:hypothetical protein